MLKDLIKNISSWPELESRIADLPTEHNRGYAFEEFCHAFFILDPVFQFKAVYRQNEVPASILKRLGYPGRKDIGIDGVAISNDNKITTYQAKFRRDRNNTPTLRELSTFFTMSDRADWRITITNANKLPSAVRDRTRQRCILSDRFCQLKPDFFKRLRVWISKKTITPPKKRPPHKTQREAINAALKHFKDNSRGQMILPCGTGKTLAAMWIVEKLGGRRILVMVPSLALMSQTLREWAENTSLRPFRYLCLCSDTTVDLGNDSPIEHIYEMDVPVTTDTDVVAEFLNNNTQEMSILFSTYQSSKVLSEATLKSKTQFDTAIFDEAHRTAGTQASIWSLALDDKNVPAKRRIFMTATPRIYAPHITKKAKDEDVLLCSMDDHIIYGEPFYEITFGQAIERDLITDYKVVVICITDAEVRELVKKESSVITTDNQEWDAKALAKRLALAKALYAYNFKKIFTFHGKVTGAKAFTDTESPYSIKQVIEMVDAKKHKQDEIEFFHVNGTMSSGDRKAQLDEFKEAQIGIMSNARCLTEGVDVPAVDAIAFIDPKKSLIDIVQATGRAMRKSEGKDRGYIFVPVVVGADDGPEECLESSDFKTVWQILQAMVEQDQHLQDNVSRLRVLQGKGEVGSKEWKAAMAEYTEKFEFFNLPGKIDVARFTETLYTKAIEVIAKSWDFRYGELIKYKEQFGDCNVPNRWAENKQLASWVTHQRSNYQIGILSKDRIRRLEEIGFVWEWIDLQWEEMFIALTVYKDKNGDCNVPANWAKNKQLASWVGGQRKNYRKEKLSEDRIKRLEEIGFVWGRFESKWEEMFIALKVYKDKNGDCNVPNKGAENEQLGRWVGEQRKSYQKGELDKGRIKRLEEIGFVWERLNSKWEEKFIALTKYKKKFGDCNVPNRWAENKQLGSWVGGQRKSYQKGTLIKERIKQLKDIGFVWEKLESQWENIFNALTEYKDRYGDCNVPDQWAENKQLGSWVGAQRKNYRKEKLSEDRIKRLEDIGFEWNLIDLQWEEMFTMLKEYIDKHGDCKVPNKWVKNKQLGKWISHQRANYQKGILSKNRTKRLEDIGFVWKLISFVRSKASWEEMFSSLKEYKDRHGDCNVPNRWADNNQLASWVTNQRTNYKRRILSEDRIKRLEEIGFVWERFDSKWEEMFTMLKEYKDKYGDCNVSSQWVVTKQLGMWVGYQRGSYQKGKMDKDRIKRLEEIEFEWNPIDSQWEEMFTILKEYKDKHGNCNVPGQWAENKQLDNWVGAQRRNCQKKILSKDRIKRLEEIEFVWNPIDSKWEEMFTILKEYKDKHGNCNVPGQWAENKQLGNWVGAQRRNCQKKILSKDRIKRLEEIEFVWNPIDSKWEEMFIALTEYKKNFGDCIVPRHWTENKQLGMWVRHQRANYQKGKLDKDCIKRLENIGFVWEPLEAYWETKFVLLKEYKDKYGYCNVPSRWAENKQLGKWVSHQRANYQKGKLDKDCIKRLEDIDFMWNPIASQWEEMFITLTEYKKKFGDCNVPSRWAENKQLGMWVGRQRKFYKKRILSKDRIKRLEEIGFAWKPPR